MAFVAKPSKRRRIPVDFNDDGIKTAFETIESMFAVIQLGFNWKREVPLSYKVF